MVRAVEANVTAAQRWIVLYVKRWLKAPLALPDGTLAGRDRGTPQGPGGPGESHPRAPTERNVTVSHHSALLI